jgi:hypothetical protein
MMTGWRDRAPSMISEIVRFLKTLILSILDCPLQSRANHVLSQSRHGPGLCRQNPRLQTLFPIPLFSLVSYPPSYNCICRTSLSFLLTPLIPKGRSSPTLRYQEGV